MPAETRNRRVLAAIVVIAVLTFLYSILIVQRPLAWVLLMLFLGLLYVAWRFVHAVERIAAALED